MSGSCLEFESPLFGSKGEARGEESRGGGRGGRSSSKKKTYQFKQSLNSNLFISKNNNFGETTRGEDGGKSA